MAKGYNQFLQGLSGKVGAIVVTAHRETTIMRKRVYTNTSDSPLQLQARARIRALAVSWAALSPLQMRAWMTLGDQMLDSRGTRTLSGYQAYTSVNGLLLACGQDPLDDAPLRPDYPPALPPLLLESTYRSAGHVFTLDINSAAYDGLVQVYACAPASAGRNSFSRSAYTLLTTLDGLTAGSTPLTTAYVAHYGPAALGQKVAVRLVPVSASGFRGPEIDPTALVVAPSLAATAAEPLDDAQQKAA